MTSTTNHQLRRYLEAAALLITSHQSVEKKRRALADAEKEHTRIAQTMMERLYDIETRVVCAGEEQSVVATPLELQMEGCFVRVDEEWHDFAKDRLYEAVVTGSLPESMPSLDRLLREMAQVESAES